MLMRIHHKNPNPKKIKKLVECLNDGSQLLLPQIINILKEIE